MTSLLFDRHPWFWRYAVAGFFATIIESTLFLAFNLQFSGIINPVILLSSGLFSLPAIYGALIEFTRIDTAKGAGRRIAAVMSCVILIVIIFGLGMRSLNNMLALFGLGIPFYALLRGAWIPVYLAASSIFVLSAVIVRKYALTTNFEEPTSELHQKWTVGGTMMRVSVVLIFLGVAFAYSDSLALEGLIMTVSGLVLFPAGRLVWKRSKKKKLSGLDCDVSLHPRMQRTIVAVDADLRKRVRPYLSRIQESRVE